MSDWTVSVHSPFYDVLKEDLTSGPVVFRDLFPDIEQLLRTQLARLEALLYPSSDFPMKRSTSKQRNLVVLIDDMGGVAFTRGEERFSSQHISMSYIAHVAATRTTQAEAKQELAGVMTHELVHSVQHSCPRVPSGLIEGVADVCRMQVGLGAAHWREVRGHVEFGWDAGYEKTAYFLRWIAESDGLADFVPRLNRAIQRRSSWDEHAFQEASGKSLGELWAGYVEWRKAQKGKHGAGADGYRAVYLSEPPEEVEEPEPEPAPSCPA